MKDHSSHFSGCCLLDFTDYNQFSLHGITHQSCISNVDKNICCPHLLGKVTHTEFMSKEYSGNQYDMAHVDFCHSWIGML